MTLKRSYKTGWETKQKLNYFYKIKVYNYYRNRKRNYRQKEFWRKGPALKSPFFVINPIVIIIKGESQRFLNFPLTILSILSKFMQWTTVKNCHFLFLAFLLCFVVFLYVLCALLHSVFLYDVLLLHGFRLYVVMIWNIKEPFLWCNQWWFQQLVPDDVKSNQIKLKTFWFIYPVTDIIGRFLSWLWSRTFTFGYVSRDTSLVIGKRLIFYIVFTRKLALFPFGYTVFLRY